MASSGVPCNSVEATPSMEQCMNTYGVNEDQPGDWVFNSVSRSARFWSCGAATNGPDTPAHDHDPQELARCRTLATEAAAVMGDTWRLLRSGSDPDTQPFFVTANVGEAVAKRVDAALVRQKLGGVIHPEAKIVIEPLREGTEWWSEIEEDAEDMAGDEPGSTRDDLVKNWRDLIAWFERNGLSSPSFVRTTMPEESCSTLGCVFPCFVAGITDKGSLVGIATHVVE